MASIEDNNDNFDDFDFDNEEDDELYLSRFELNPDESEPEHQREAKANKSPIAKKAKEIFDLAHTIYQVLDEKGKEHIGQSLLNSASILYVKTMATLRVNDWLICMGNAAIIREHGIYLELSRHSLSLYSKLDKSYVNLLTNEVKEFKKLFIEWVISFNTLEDNIVEDDWHIFIRPKK